MKKARFLSFLCVPVLLCGCSAGKMFGKTTPNFERTYTVKAEISCGELDVTADVTRNGKGDYVFAFTEPDHLMGMSIALSDSGTQASLGSLSVEVDSTDAYKLVPDIIVDSIDSLSTVSADKITEVEGVLTLNTEADGKKVVVTCDETGGLLTLKCPSHKLSVKFSGQQELSAPPTEETFEIIVTEGESS